MIDNIKIIENNDCNFSKNLKIIKNCPNKLYYCGNIELLNIPSIAVIGSRDCTDYGVNICKRFVEYYTKYDICIVNGMARGIDGVALRTCVENGGRAIAVLGGGISNISPKINAELAEQIVSNNGLIISEYDNKAIGYKSNFHERNRIISGLSDAVLVIEAAEKSGTAVMVDYANEQGKPVFACPGRLDFDTGIGVNKMIQKGAAIAVNPEDVINNVNIFKNKFLPSDKKQEKRREKLELTFEQKLLQLLDTSKSLDELELITAKNRMDLLVELTLLESRGLVVNIGGVGYKRV